MHRLVLPGKALGVEALGSEVIEATGACNAPDIKDGEGCIDYRAGYSNGSDLVGFVGFAKKGAWLFGGQEARFGLFLLL
ncbi:MAG: hypothetical protein KA779_03995 [Propionivibrio sp.]|nr:hypothetical protein [Propionivibrio sp.]MBP6709818.1 hypothetical protein [Propionivibrio sp.]MBP7523899.1 hypothetical protein [Propionivibrio sp.]